MEGKSLEEILHDINENLDEMVSRLKTMELDLIEVKEEEIASADSYENLVSERLRGIASDMRNIGASSMTPRELFAYWAHEVDKAADLAVTLSNGEHRRKEKKMEGKSRAEILREINHELNWMSSKLNSIRLDIDHIASLGEYSRELALVKTKVEEAEMWLQRHRDNGGDRDEA